MIYVGIFCYDRELPNFLPAELDAWMFDIEQDICREDADRVKLSRTYKAVCRARENIVKTLNKRDRDYSYYSVKRIIPFYSKRVDSEDE